MDNKSRVRRESQARFCEKLGLKCPCLLDCSVTTIRDSLPLLVSSRGVVSASGR